MLARNSEVGSGPLFAFLTIALVGDWRSEQMGPVVSHPSLPPVNPGRVFAVERGLDHWSLKRRNTRRICFQQKFYRMRKANYLDGVGACLLPAPRLSPPPTVRKSLDSRLAEIW